MAVVTGFTAERMQAIEDSSVVSGTVNASYRLILTKKDGSTVDAGYVRGATGAAGANAQAVMSVTDSDTVDLTLTGAGTTASPWNIKADANVGTSAQRDLRFVPPTTDALRVALANKRLLWFNTEFGWHESYYAPTLTGLTAPALVAGVPAGWYPVNDGPRAKLTASGPQAHSGGSYFTNWQAMGVGGSWRNSTHISRPSNDLAVLQTIMPGRYDFEIAMFFPNGSGTGIWEFDYISDSGSSPVSMQTQNPLVLQASYGQVERMAYKDIVLREGGVCFMKTTAATWSIGNATVTWMQMRYLGPAIATR